MRRKQSLEWVLGNAGIFRLGTRGRGRDGGGRGHKVPKESGMQGRKAGKPPKGAVQLVVSMELIFHVPPQSGDRI